MMMNVKKTKHKPARGQSQLAKASLSRAQLTKAVLCHLPSHDQNAPSLCVGLYDEQGKIQHIWLEAIKPVSPLWGGIYYARILNKEKGPKGKSFLEISGSEAMLMHETATAQGGWLKVQVAREAFQHKGIGVNERIKLPSRYLDFWPSSLGAPLKNPVKEAAKFTFIAHAGLGKGQNAALWLDRFQAYDFKANMDIPMLGGKFILKAPIVQLTPDQAFSMARDLLHQAHDLREKTPDITTSKRNFDLLAPSASMLHEMIFHLAAEAKIIIEDWDIMARLKPLIAQYAPDITNISIAASHHKQLWEESGLAEAYAVSQQKEILLPQGGRLSIEVTEALNVIDIDHHKGLTLPSSTHRTVNLNAVPEIIRQIKLRNFGGIILIDPLRGDVNWSKQKQDLALMVDLLRKGFKQDEIKTDILGVTQAGLIEMIRQRRKASNLY